MISLLWSKAQALSWKAKHFLTQMYDAAMGLRSPKDRVCSETQLMVVNGICFPK